VDNRFVNLEDVRRVARGRLPKPLFDLVEGSADDEVTVRRNLAAWDRYALVPFVLRDVEERSQEVELFGVRLATPVILAPTGLLQLFSRDGDRAAARAAVEREVAFTMSTVSMTSLEDVAAVGGDRLWFQLYVLRDRAATATLVHRAADAGVETLFVTVDVPVGGNRERDVRNGFSVPFRVTSRTIAGIARRPRWAWQYLTGPPLELANIATPGPASKHNPAVVTEAVTSQFNPALTWSDLAWLRSIWPGTLVVKGIMSARDAAQAVEIGADGVVVSNHGGRQLGSAPATADVLPEVVAEVGPDLPVLVDGGIRRGTDVLKALALGARAVLVGRPYLFGLSAAGQAGVESVIDILHRELDRALALSGQRSVVDLESGLLRKVQLS
jgi:isopentenyl diphosphate isomerase/L-lactate dehydrogenase-like FMN-dependent dehydrogenase